MPASLREASRKGEGDGTGTNPTSGTAAVKAKGTGGSVCFLTAGKADGKTNDHCSTVLPAPAAAAFPGKQRPALLRFTGTWGSRAAGHPTAVGASLEIGVRGEESTQLLPRLLFSILEKISHFFWQMGVRTFQTHTSHESA